MKREGRSLSPPNSSRVLRQSSKLGYGEPRCSGSLPLSRNIPGGINGPADPKNSSRHLHGRCRLSALERPPCDAEAVPTGRA